MSDFFICKSCGRGFDEPASLKEPDGLETPPYRYSDGCPYCYSDDYVNLVTYCDCCGRGIYQEEKYYRLETDECFCSDCIEEREAI